MADTISSLLLGAVLAVLTKLLESPDADVREQTALAISSLTLVFQGRLAATDSGALAALGTALADANASVRAASANKSYAAESQICTQLMFAALINAQAIHRAMRRVIPRAPRRSLSFDF